jgi:hypothetical protein
VEKNIHVGLEHAAARCDIDGVAVCELRERDRDGCEHVDQLGINDDSKDGVEWRVSLR